MQPHSIKAGHGYNTNTPMPTLCTAYTIHTLTVSSVPNATMNGVARHTACKLCRDRKVRCSGEQPACETCQRAGEECVYVSACRPNKVDLVQTVETLQERLGRLPIPEPPPTSVMLRESRKSNCAGWNRQGRRPHPSDGEPSSDKQDGSVIRNLES